MMEKTVSLRRRGRRKNRTGRKLAILLVVACLVILLFLLAPWLCPYDPYAQNLALAHMAPDPSHILGTDRYGRDLSPASLWAAGPRCWPLLPWPLLLRWWVQ